MLYFARLWWCVTMGHAAGRGSVAAAFCCLLPLYHTLSSPVQRDDVPHLRRQAKQRLCQPQRRLQITPALKACRLRVKAHRSPRSDQLTASRVIAKSAELA